MKTLKVIYVPKSKLYPAFGIAYTKKRLAQVRKDLPKPVKKYVTQHELYHLRDNFKKGGFWEEFKACIYGAIKNPIGALMCLIMWFSPRRLWWRFKKKGFRP